MLPPLQIMEEDYLLLYLRKILQDLLQPLVELRTLRLLVRRRRLRARRDGKRIGLPQNLPANQVPRTVPHDGHEPPGELLWVPAIIQSLQRYEERLLGPVFGIFVPPRHRVGHGVRGPLVPLDKQAEGAFVASSCPPYQLTIAVRCEPT
ncbi:MAG: hypothetical protein P8170_11015 [Gemmatimonadota bacterium]